MFSSFMSNVADTAKAAVAETQPELPSKLEPKVKMSVCVIGEHSELKSQFMKLASKFSQYNFYLRTLKVVSKDITPAMYNTPSGPVWRYKMLFNTNKGPIEFTALDTKTEGKNELFSEFYQGAKCALLLESGDSEKDEAWKSDFFTNCGKDCKVFGVNAGYGNDKTAWQPFLKLAQMMYGQDLQFQQPPSDLMTEAMVTKELNDKYAGGFF